MAIDALIQRLSGIIVNATLDSVIFRVAPEDFDSALDELAKLGDVTAREVKSEDVTDQYRDLRLRSEVAEASRQRLMEILKKTGQVKDVLEVERDIRRLTEEIEGMKGLLRVLQDKVDLATITVQLEEKALEPLPARHRSSSPFSWINEVGLDHLQRQLPQEMPLSGEGRLTRLVRGPQFRLGVAPGDLLPSGFVPVWYAKSLLWGATPEDYRLRVSCFRVRQKGNLDFWGQAPGR